MGTWRAAARGEPGYPRRLGDLERPPERVFLEGSWDHGGPMVAIVGARDATGDGVDLAHELAADLATRGIAVISGLARGVDAAAHRGALAAGGPTAAVLGTPLDRVYPLGHETLQRAVASSLGLLSEIAPGHPPTRGTFASRNRLLAALADAVVLVQGRAGSGSLLTVAAARALGRPVGAVPWDPREPLGEAPLALVRSGHAILVRGAADVAALCAGTDAAAGAGNPAAAAGARNPAPAAGHPEPLGLFEGEADAAGLGEGEARLLAALRRRAEPLETAARRADLTIAEAGAALVGLELRGRAERLAGGAVRLTRGR